MDLGNIFDPMKKLFLPILAFSIGCFCFAQGNAGSVNSSNVASPSASAKAEANDFWISKTGKRHNNKCRYYKNCKGRPCSKTEGIPCKICGG